MTTTETARTAPLYRVTSIDENRAELRLRSGVVIRYWRDRRSGYVFEETDTRPGSTGQQVCEGLAGSGDTLCRTGGDLAEIIRREARTVSGRANLQARDDDARLDAVPPVRRGECAAIDEWEDQQHAAPKGEGSLP